ncbi:hypothetical protein JJE66_35150 [Bradyrhizobium diazoefficiens]|uniref:hypothetical protein n=1 Tax=Bradyrhizobium diazoefficiens TaxID=1355477 RepID=UPI00190CC17C|nr:hypothetical protein [Bradyrhizobium diazoefficiens]MBK3666438.1 hypothetical protein [Bradyrhizobium diazoefficiens]
MTMETLTIPIVRTSASDGIAPVELIEGMSTVSASRSTRAVIKAYKAAAGVTSNLRFPLVADCPVNPVTLGRAMRKVWKAALNGVEKGGSILVELRPKKEMQVVEIIASPAATVRQAE